MNATTNEARTIAEVAADMDESIRRCNPFRIRLNLSRIAGMYDRPPAALLEARRRGLAWFAEVGR